MPKLKRFYDDNRQTYFITSKTFRNEKIFKDEKNIKILLECITYLKEKGYFKLFAWVVLLDHIHLLLEITGKKNISQIMHDLKSYTANRISRVLESRGTEASATRFGNKSVGETLLIPQRRRGFNASSDKSKGNRSIEVSATERKYVKIWQTSFYDHIIRNEEDFRTHLDYIHYNSIKHNLVQKPKEWQWSSYKVFLLKGHYEEGWGHRVQSESIRIIGRE